MSATTTESDVIHQLWDHISNCYTRAADAHRRAEQTVDPDHRADLLMMEESWRRLAQSYELSEQLGRVLLEHNDRQSHRMDWQRAAVAPFDRDLELATIGAGGIDPITIPCRRILHGWVTADTRVPIDIQPTHWREWSTSGRPRAIKSAVGWRRSGSGPMPKVALLPLQSGE